MSDVFFHKVVSSGQCETCTQYHVLHIGLRGTTLIIDLMTTHTEEFHSHLLTASPCWLPSS